MWIGRGKIENDKCSKGEGGEHADSEKKLYEILKDNCFDVQNTMSCMVVRNSTRGAERLKNFIAFDWSSDYSNNSAPSPPVELDLSRPIQGYSHLSC